MFQDFKWSNFRSTLNPQFPFSVQLHLQPLIRSSHTWTRYTQSSLLYTNINLTFLQITDGFFDDSVTKVFKNSIVSKSDTEFKKNVRIDFTETPYGKIDFLESLESATGMMFPDPEDIHREFTGQQSGNDVHSFLLDICERQSVNVSADSSLSKLFDKLFGHFVESSLERPTFVLHHPLCMSPLAKEHRSIPGKNHRHW